MNLLTLLDMVAQGMSDRTVIGSRSAGLTAGQLKERAFAGAAMIDQAGAKRLVYLGGNTQAYPIALFAAAAAKVPLLPLNYRLSDDQLRLLIAREPRCVIVSDTTQRARELGRNAVVLSANDFADGQSPNALPLAEPSIDGQDIAVLLMTSGTTSAPKSAILRHHHLCSYIFGAVEYGSADENAATVVSVPPYHVAAVMNLLSNLYSGRRILYLDRFTAREWLDIVEREAITHAMVVPTMLARIVAELENTGLKVPASLKSISYGGDKTATSVISKALRLFPDVAFANAYGLTETASTIAVLGPEDHRNARSSTDPKQRTRLASVGRPLDGVRIEIYADDGTVCPPGVSGEIVVQGGQISGEYVEQPRAEVPADGWFHTRDRGYLDEDGYLFVQGRMDDTIIRGGENISPAEIEDVMLEHEAVAECAVAGLPDDTWGHRIAAFVVLEPNRSADAGKLREFVRGRLRSSKTPDVVIFRDALPLTATGKVVRQQLVASLLSSGDPAVTSGP
jgi:acyl-CoA synthetase (AMP-forming)/AMP-acid ligase II